jgi:hypothetical protein
LNACLLSDQKDEFIRLLKSNQELFSNSIDYDYGISLIYRELKILHDERHQFHDIQIEEFIYTLNNISLIIDINKIVESCLLSIQNNDDNYKSNFNESSSTNVPRLTKYAEELYIKMKNPNAALENMHQGIDFKKKYLNSLILLKQSKNSNNQIALNNPLTTRNRTSSINLNECALTSSCSNSSSENYLNRNNQSLSDSGHSEASIYSELISNCNLLNHNDIQNCIKQVNIDYEQECLGKF